MSEPVIVTTSRGVEGECMPIAAMLEAMEENIRASITWPDVPTYTVHYAGGETVQKPHDESSIADPKTTEEEKLAWADYLLDRQAADAEFEEKRGEGYMRLLAVDGFKVRDAGDDWERRHRFYGMTVPDDPLERALHYFRTEVASTQDDVYLIMLGIYRASGYDEEVLSQMEATFRASLGQGGETGAGADVDTGAADPGAEERAGMVREPDVDDDGRADSPGDRPGPVGRIGMGGEIPAHRVSTGTGHDAGVGDAIG
jgi:hypothetical protein